MNPTAERLQKFSSSVPSRWRDNAISRLENQEERRKARKFAMMVLNSLDRIGLSSQSLAEKLGVDHEALLPILKGHKLPSEELNKKISAVLSLL